MRSLFWSFNTDDGIRRATTRKHSSNRYILGSFNTDDGIRRATTTNSGSRKACFLSFNTDDGIRRATTEDVMKKAEINLFVSIPMTVLGGLQPALREEVNQ